MAARAAAARAALPTRRRRRRQQAGEAVVPVAREVRLPDRRLVLRGRHRDEAALPRLELGAKHVIGRRGRRRLALAGDGSRGLSSGDVSTAPVATAADAALQLELRSEF